VDEAKAVFDKQEDIELDKHTLYIDYGKVRVKFVQIGGIG